MKKSFVLVVLIFIINMIMACGSKSESEPKVQMIQITPSAITLKIGQTSIAKAYALYEDGSTSEEGIMWSSNIISTAIVTNDGIVIGVGEGEALITASKNEKSAFLNVKVEKEEIAFEKFESLNLVGTVTSFDLDESTQMKYMGDGVYEFKFTAPAPSIETWVTENNANQAMKFVANNDWNESYISENGKIRKAEGMENIYMNLIEGKSYTVICDFKELNYNIFETYDVFNVTGTIDGFALTPMNYVGKGIYQMTVKAPAPSIETWVTENNANQVIKFVADNDWNKSYVMDEENNLIPAEGMANIYVTWEEGKNYSIVVDFVNMKCKIEKLNYNVFNITGTIDGFSLTPMTCIGDEVYEIKIKAPAPSVETWVTEKNANQSIKFIPDEDWNNGYVGENGELRLDKGMENIYVTWEEGKTYYVKADLKNMKYYIEIVDSVQENIQITKANEYVNIDNSSIKFMFKATKDVDVKLYAGKNINQMEIVKTVKKYDYTKEEGFKSENFEAGEKYYYMIEIEKNGQKLQSEIFELNKPEAINKNIEKPEWARKAVFYEIFVRSFYDGNGDGIGDFIGLKEKMSYLKELGITAVWLMPMNESPTYHGYDVIDYRTIEKDYGGMEAFESFLSEAKANNIKVIMDMVLNHTSKQHEWFEKSALNENGYKDYYVWADEFDDTSEKWYKASNGEYYYGFYESGMPDLNYRNYNLREKIKEEVKFWIDKGIDGFRLDGSDNIDLDDDVENGWWKEFSSYVNQLNPEIFVVGENNFPGEYERVAPFFGVMQSSFNFYLYDKILAMSKGTYYDVLNDMNGMYEAYETYSQDFLDSTFIGNHDKPRIISAIRNDSEMPNDIDREKLKLAYSVLMTLPGTPFIYYGDELGQYGGVAQKDENKREPFDWYKNGEGIGMTTMEKGGFTIGSKNTFPNDGISLEEQKGTEGSVYEHLKKLIEIRKNNEFMFKIRPNRIGSPYKIYSYEIKGDINNIYVLHNVSKEKNEIEIEGNATDLISGTIYEKGKLEMKPYQSIIFESKENPIKEYPIEVIELEKSKVKIILNTPVNTPVEDDIFIPGTFNDWGNTATIEVQKLTRVSENKYELELLMEHGNTIEFKFVRGTDGKRDWNKDGLDENGNRIGTNFMYTFDSEDREIEFTIYGWLDLGMPE